jgi:hypothetical protein
MPSVCRFGGIVIYLYYNDHPPPHFHAQYAGAVLEVTIQSVGVLRGSLPAAQTSQVLAWAQKRQADLLADSDLARAGQPLQPIAP